MKPKQYSLLKLKHTLFQMRRQKKKNPIWKLTKEQVEYVENIGFPVTSYLYCIKTKTFQNVANAEHLLKDIHYARKFDRKREIYRKLTLRERKLLDRHDISYKAYKYEIHLNEFVGAY